ncbi:hypothetical protein EIN_281260 [Entamoeba invadens IP1]|uniref:F-box domain-containing protein n=1 Tax=Entamoeba invadens IP1 TaxID=370355 RepID=A0A0A1TWV7_ENTIV|nr:hypothetical protein EIN_281260 [Entamoeba invadens IP1]ELP85765.1 hypothetical protein EIN_281260 [Entamoeba invadens IP1]|eukprot:XP_004185111.1 hypothetical protein EIN_281260 [Entamoeba invadens IP1]
MSQNSVELIKQELNESGWEEIPAKDPYYKIRTKNYGKASLECIFKVEPTQADYYELFQSPEAVSTWYPFLHSVVKKDGEYTGMFLSPTAQTFLPFQFQYDVQKTSEGVYVVLIGTPTIFIYIDIKTSEIHIIYSLHAVRSQLMSSCYLIFKCLEDILSRDEDVKIRNAIEQVCYPHYTTPPLSRYIHESQRVRITANEDGDEMFIQADLRIPLRPQTFFEIMTSRNALTSITTENEMVKESRIFTIRHFLFNTLIQPTVSTDVVLAYRLTQEWTSIVFKSIESDCCSKSHTKTILFQESVINFRQCGEDDTRVRFSVLLSLPVVSSYPPPLREKFLSNLVAPILFFFATIATPIPLSIQNVPLTDQNFPEMTTIESMSSLLLNAITLSKSKKKQVTTLQSMPEQILLKIFANVGVDEIKNVQELCKQFYSLVNGSMATETWKGIFNSTCYFNGKATMEPTKENLMAVSKTQSLWKSTDFKPKTFQIASAPITCIEIGNSIYFGTDDGELLATSRDAFDPKNYHLFSSSNASSDSRSESKSDFTDRSGYIGMKEINSEICVVQKSGKAGRFYGPKIDMKGAYDKADFSDDGKVVFGWKDHILVVQMSTGDVINKFMPHLGYVTQVRQMGHLFVSSGTDKLVKLFDSRSKTITMELRGHSTSVKGVNVIGDWSLISCGEEKATILWDIRMGKMVTKSDVAVIPTCMGTYNRKIVCGGANGQIVLQWNKSQLRDRRYIFKVPNVPTTINLDDHTLLVGTNTGTLYQAVV